jgi:hypothetical protein
MLPHSKSEYDQDDADENDLDNQTRGGTSGSTEHHSGAADPGNELDGEGDLDLEPEEDEDLGQEEQKPKKKGIGKGTLLAAVGATVLVALCGAAYVLQGQLQTQAPVSNKIAVDPSLLEQKPAVAPMVSLPVEPTVTPAVLPAPTLAVPAAVGTEMTPTAPASVSAITAPPSDPFGGVTAPVTPASTPIAAPIPVVTGPATPQPSKAVAITPAPGVEAPRTDPFGLTVAEKPVVEKAPIAVLKTETPAKSVRVVKDKTVDIDEVEIAKPRVVRKVTARKPPVVRQDMTRSESHPSQERMQPQSSESFQGYEKLF